KPIAMARGLAAFGGRAVGRRIGAVDGVGKGVVIRLAGGGAGWGDAIVLEPRMTGLVLLADSPDAEHLRFRLELAGGPAKEVLFWDRRGLGSVRLVSPAEFERRYGLDCLGPDALSITPKLLRIRLGASRREIKVALLDQRAVAGIGNLYASEILHLAGIHPRRRCDQLRANEWRRLCRAIVEVLEEAIRCEGSTLSDGTYRNALNQAGGYQARHRVYDRGGQRCLTCRRADVVRIVQGQRSTYFCRGCQRGVVSG
ncbi:MAG: DNA-formamidopyrimidine glycosylase family protein, partial [Pirellulales bacterium]